MWKIWWAPNNAEDRGSTVVKVLCYKSKGLWFDPMLNITFYSGKQPACYVTSNTLLSMDMKRYVVCAACQYHRQAHEISALDTFSSGRSSV